MQVHKRKYWAFKCPVCNHVEGDYDRNLMIRHLATHTDATSIETATTHLESGYTTIERCNFNNCHFKAFSQFELGKHNAAIHSGGPVVESYSTVAGAAAAQAACAPFAASVQETPLAGYLAQHPWVQAAESHVSGCRVSCLTPNVIYLITCLKCKLQYVGETKKPLHKRMYEHIRSIQKFGHTTVPYTPVGEHFNNSCHKPAKFIFQILETIKGDPHSPETKIHRHNRELWWILNLQTLDPLGLNTQT